MTWISKSVSLFGAILLAHACYSAQEHSALQSLRAATATLISSGAAAAASTTSSLPVDITIETIIAILIICVGLVIGTPPLRPIQWRVWAGKVEREGVEGFKDNNGEVSKDFFGNPFLSLEMRPGFADIRKQRKEFAEWVKNGAEK